MGHVSKDMAVPTIVSQADFYHRYHRYNRSASIRLVMLRGDDGYRLKASTYGVGPLPDSRLPDKPIKNGFERIAFDDEITALEQLNYEVNWISQKQVKGMTFQQLRATAMPNAGVDSVLPKSSPEVPNVLMQKLRAGVRVTVVIDALGKIAMYDPNQRSTLEKGVLPREKTSYFLKSGLSKDLPFSNVLEGFYSDRFGLHITDAIVVLGTDISQRPFSERIKAVSTVWEVKASQSTLSDSVILPVSVSRSELRSLAGKNVNNPVYLLRSPQSVSAILDDAACLKSLVVDYAPAVDVALTSGRNELNGIVINNNVFEPISCEIPSKLFKYDMSQRFIAGVHTPSKTPLIF